MPLTKVELFIVTVLASATSLSLKVLPTPEVVRVSLPIKPLKAKVELAVVLPSYALLAAVATAVKALAVITAESVWPVAKL